jgi:hypothetical protein
MGKMNVAQDVHIVPIRVTTTDTATFVAPHVNMKLYEKVEFIVLFGTCSGDSFVLTVTQSAATAGSTSTAIAARYRMPAAAGTDTMGDVTALESTGLTLTYGTFTLKGIIVDIDSSDLTTESKPYVGLTFTDPGSASAVNTILALCWPKYPKETNSGALT